VDEVIGTHNYRLAPNGRQRGGDRQANAALHRIVISRLRWDLRARNYLERRQAKGETHRETISCLKRYAVARSTGSSSRPSALTCPKPLDKHRGIFSPHLTTARDGRIGAWAAANNVEIAYTPTKSSW
jgi:hypothetical protein